jgi:hypothetical protein
MVAGQYAQAAGIDRQAFVQAKFRAEIGDQILFGVQVTVDTLALTLGEVGVIGR